MKAPIRKVDKPWGYELIFAHTDNYAGKILHVDPGHALSLQYHEQKDETLFLQSGEVDIQIQDGDDGLVSHRMTAGESFHIRPGVRHRMVAGAAGCDIIEVSTPQLDDVVRLEDRYGRV
ncbi:MAG: cupin domain-containing protein [Acidobacteriota bacterium]|nr:cupin domain-containing protein [Acidobacteriota bacterium]